MLLRKKEPLHSSFSPSCQRQNSRTPPPPPTAPPPPSLQLAVQCYSSTPRLCSIFSGFSAHLGTFTYRSDRGNLPMCMINVQRQLIVTLHCTHRISTCALMRSRRDNRWSSVSPQRLSQLEFAVVLLLLLQKVASIMLPLEPWSLH